MENILSTIANSYNLNDNESEFLNKIDFQNLNTQKIHAVLNKLIEYKMDKASVIAYLCYEIKKLPNDSESDVKKLYNSLNLETEINDNLDRIQQAEMLRKMIISMSNDIRVIIIKLCIIYYESSTCKLPLSYEQENYLLNVREIFAPLAERLGLNTLKSELEDNCLKFLNPDIYESLNSNIMLKKEDNQKQIEITREKLEQIVNELGIKNATIMARQKHYSSIYKKLKSKNVTLANIYDLIAMRVIVNSIEECYAVLGKIHGIYKPMTGRFKDYIASPKPNGYQSLHTTIIVENNRPLEIQIRTQEMHKMAEYGVFSHWLYKEKRTKMTELDKKLSWLREIMENSKELSSDEFISTLKTNLCEGRVFVQTPKGKVLEFPEGANLIDFAYSIHSDIGNSCIGGKINGQIKPLNSELKNGDVIEIITSTSSKGPSRDWLKIAKTPGAKNKINAFFKKEFKEENIKLGRSILENAIKNKGFSPNKVMEEKYLNQLLSKYAFNTVDELLSATGYGSVPINQITNRLIAIYEQEQINLPSIDRYVSSTLQIKTNKDGVLVDGDSGMLIRYAGCCTPIYGEEILGYISRGRGVTIHRKDCHNIKYFEKERLVDANWAGNSDNKVSVSNIKIISSPNENFLLKLAQELSKLGVKIINLDSKITTNYKVNTNLKVEVSNKNDLDKIVSTIKSIKCVDEVM